MARMENGKTLVAKGLMNVNKFDGIFRKSGHEPMYVRRVQHSSELGAKTYPVVSLLGVLHKQLLLDDPRRSVPWLPAKWRTTAMLHVPIKPLFVDVESDSILDQVLTKCPRDIADLGSSKDEDEEKWVNGTCLAKSRYFMQRYPLSPSSLSLFSSSETRKLSKLIQQI